MFVRSPDGIVMRRCRGHLLFTWTKNMKPLSSRPCRDIVWLLAAAHVALIGSHFVRTQESVVQYRARKTHRLPCNYSVNTNIWFVPKRYDGVNLNYITLTAPQPSFGRVTERCNSFINFRRHKLGSKRPIPRSTQRQSLTVVDSRKTQKVAVSSDSQIRLASRKTINVTAWVKVWAVNAAADRLMLLAWT